MTITLTPRSDMAPESSPVFQVSIPAPVFNGIQPRTPMTFVVDGREFSGYVQTQAASVVKGPAMRTPGRR